MDGKDCVEDELNVALSYHLPRPENEKEKTYFVCENGVVCDTLYKEEFQKAMKLGDDVAMRLIGLGADEILRTVKEAIPNSAC